MLPKIREPMARRTSPSHSTARGWIYEKKVDGWRVIASNDAGVRLVSRNAKDLTRRFPDWPLLA